MTRRDLGTYAIDVAAAGVVAVALWRFRRNQPETLLAAPSQPATER